MGDKFIVPGQLNVSKSRITKQGEDNPYHGNSSSNPFQNALQGGSSQSYVGSYQGTHYNSSSGNSQGSQGDFTSSNFGDNPDKYVDVETLPISDSVVKVYHNTYTKVVENPTLFLAIFTAAIQLMLSFIILSSLQYLEQKIDRIEQGFQEINRVDSRG